MYEKIVGRGLSFDDVLLVPREATFHPRECSTKTFLTSRVCLNVPFMSSAMDTVTESSMAIAISLAGGIGIIHKNMSIEEQIKEVTSVKQHEISKEEYEQFSSDSTGRLLVGAAVGIGSETNYVVEKLVNAQVDLVVLDSAHGHSSLVLETLRTIKKEYPELLVVAGNVSTSDGALYLIEGGADIVKVGMGPGSICTTRIVAGIGVPQLTAVMDVYRITKEHGIPLIADGGIKYSGDVTKALAAGADAVMMGNVFAGCQEAAGDFVEQNGRKYKCYRGMGSMSAMKKGSSDRYFQDSKTKLVPEGVESLIPCRDSLHDVIFQLVGGLKSGMGYCGTKTIDELKKKSRFIEITNSGLKESHPHNLSEICSSPNYDPN